MAIDGSSVSFSKTQRCLKEINEILNDIQSKLRDNSVLDNHEELKRILFSKLIVQYTQEFNDNAEKLWNDVIKKHNKLQHYNDTKRFLFNQYIGFTDVIVMLRGVEEYNKITELEDYRVCKKFLKTRNITSHPTDKNIKALETQNSPEKTLSLESFTAEDVLGKSMKLFQHIITSLQ